MECPKEAVLALTGVAGIDVQNSHSGTTYSLARLLPVVAATGPSTATCANQQSFAYLVVVRIADLLRV